MLTLFELVLPPTFGAAAFVYLALAYSILRPNGSIRDSATGYLLLMTGIYLAATGLRFGASEPMLLHAARALSILATGFIPVAMYALYRGFTGQPLARWEFILLCGVPGLTFILVLTHPLHTISVPVDLHSSVYRFTDLDRDTWLGYLFLPYTFGLFAYSLFALGGRVSSLARAHRRPVLAIIGSASLPALAWLLRPAFGNELADVPMAALVLVLALPLNGWIYTLLASSDFRPVGFHTVFDHVADAIMILDEQSRIVSANRGAQHLLGQDESDLVGSHIDGRLPGVQRSGQALATRLACTVEMDARFLEVSLAPLNDERGRSAGTVVVARDTTKRRRTQKKLAESERFIRSLIENSPNGVLRFRRRADDFQCTFANRAAERFLNDVSPGLVGVLLSDLRVLQPATVRRAFESRGMRIAHGDIEVEAAGRWLRLVPEPVGADFSLTVIDITQNKLAETRMIADAHHDPLTGVLNRRGFETTATDVLDDVVDAAVVYIDLNQFKRVNDEHGHNVGDSLLKAFSRRVEVCLRPEDLVVRMGGDEFAVVLPDISADDARRVVGRLARTAAEPYFIDGKHIRCAASIGVAFKPDHGLDIGDLLDRADQAMYLAKKAGSAEAANDGTAFVEAASA